MFSLFLLLAEPETSVFKWTNGVNKKFNTELDYIKNKISDKLYGPCEHKDTFKLQMMMLQEREACAERNSGSTVLLFWSLFFVLF